MSSMMFKFTVFFCVSLDLISVFPPVSLFHLYSFFEKNKVHFHHLIFPFILFSREKSNSTKIVIRQLVF